MILQFVLLSIASYIGLYLGTFLAFIAPEEILNIEKNLKRASFIITTLLAIALFATVKEIIPLTIIGIFFVWLVAIYKKRIDVHILATITPFFILISNTSGAVAACLLLLGLPIGTLFVKPNVKKEKLKEKKRIILKELCVKTKTFWIILIVLTILSLLFN